MTLVVSGLVLGLAGSLGHCVGMCGPVTLLLARWGLLEAPWHPRAWLVHIGRLTTYSLLGLLAGGLGSLFRPLLPDLRAVQGVVALLGGVALLYAFLTLAGLAPWPDRWAGPLVRRWGQGFSALARQGLPGGRAVSALAVGLAWGLLPCGLVGMALLVALAGGSWASGGAVMLAFGAGTLPALLTVGALGRRGLPRLPFLRRATAGLVLATGLQMLLRGASAWGMLPHMRVGQLVLW